MTVCAASGDAREGRNKELLRALLALMCARFSATA
jgi:hypothetical protein